MMLDAGLPWPRYSASLKPLRSSARFAARRTRRSAHGDFGSHCWVKTSHWLTVGRMTLSVSPGVRVTSCASGPRSPYAMSVSPRFSFTSRVDSSGTDFRTMRFTDGTFRQ